MHRIMKLIMSVGLIAASVAPGVAADHRYEHNGSTMRVEVSGSSVRIYYEKPRQGLSAHGVRPGTLLFDGKVSNGYLEGMSRIFNANCGEVDYYVYGDFVPGQSFKLSGAAPVLSGMSCRIVDNVYTGPNANLQFNALRAGAGRPANVGRPGCVTGVNSYLNVRSGPGADYGRIGTFAAGSCGIEIVNNHCLGEWCLTRQGPTTGWVNSRFLNR
ncbi:SH3 domain-containing protein [Roseibium aggregatum]|uniref:SH3 domain-containing protein n=1 Tax=Roseibium aggregatum TaxID=187304 RepID=A0A939EF84_9HYPH|nr:SH3 domain-containing protein [Roseibium aggregatum]MBN9672152.1 SH3 domain-containing protein [Roseibium aggregatum]